MATAKQSPAQPAVVLGLTFLLIGLTFALPILLVPNPGRHGISPLWSAPVSNAYACAAWAGWAHFLYAFRGQGKALTSIKDEWKGKRLWLAALCLVAAVALLVLVRWSMGTALFSGLVWVYFIDHFAKAERTFEGLPLTSNRWLSSYQPLLAFAWLSVLLLEVGQIGSQPWLVWIISLVLAAFVLFSGGWKRLTSGDSRGPLLSLFFVGEALIWSTVGHSGGGPTALAGVYVFHIAAGSYFHYLGSYFFAASKAHKTTKASTYLSILAVNLGVFALGYLTMTQPWMKWLNPILGVEWFTLWVAVHLVASDLFPWLKTWRRGEIPNVAPHPKK